MSVLAVLLAQKVLDFMIVCKKTLAVRNDITNRFCKLKMLIYNTLRRTWNR